MHFIQLFNLRHLELKINDLNKTLLKRQLFNKTSNVVNKFGVDWYIIASFMNVKEDEDRDDGEEYLNVFLYAKHDNNTQ